MPIHTTTPRLTPEQYRILMVLEQATAPIRQESIPDEAGLEREIVDTAILVLLSYQLITVDLGSGMLAYRITLAGRDALRAAQQP